ncbi:amino acid/amide ABC transporter substrate-binding protein, HAAT family [Haloferax elongans ATCC BAA-1513]|uniref:Amino acid/amide ABC transporter substrate-binding protein, HAAT family n=1 Tax=Haloferax elongans ATCC BAA-1513 TaxID=1230453 RepID=M0HT66_HALEO|nr:ABC transporter substrate-binding protein [Haloferax elongans]ELZ87671.1 amino acid/amide ABC transporter substrate-binding protein, HAAT family [Haloferax elongans ATCC BAA-1513]
MTLSYNRRGLLRAAGSAVALGSLSGCVGALDNQANEPVRFGAVLPVSGSLETLGTHGMRAVEQAVADINRAGGVLDRPVELTAVDTEANAQTAVEGYKTLVDEGVVGFVGGLVSDASIALAPKAASDGIMEMSPASTSPALTDAGRADGRKYFGRTVPSDALQAIAMAKILDAPQYANADSIAILATDNAYGDGLASSMKTSTDAEVVSDVRYDPTASSFDGVIDEVFQNSPDAVGFVSVAGQETGVLDAYGSSDYEAPWVFSAGMFGSDVPKYYEGFYSASLSSVRTDGYFHLSQRLSDIAPLAAYSVNAYDALFLMAAAAEKAGEATGAAIADTIQSVSGGTGHTVSVGDFGRVRSLTDAGRELNYQGAASGVDLTEDLEPLSPYVVEKVHNYEVRQLELLQRQFFESGGNQ